MFKVLLTFLLATAAAKQQNDTSANQLMEYKNKTKDPGILTTNAGAFVDYNSATSTLNKELLTNQYFVEELGHFDREIIPERVAHGQGTGAFGYFEVTHDITHICKADFLSEIGKKTPVATRFSTAVIHRGASEFTRDTRGFAVKFYTKEGNYDFTGINSEMFSVKDPLLFPSLVRAAKSNPVTNLGDSTMFFDFVSYHPEALFKVLFLTTDYGMPDGYRHMSGHAIHTFEVYNKNGTKHFVRIHFTPDTGIQTLNATQVSELSSDTNYFTRDLYNAIANGNYPSWTMKMQILTQDNVTNAGFDVFDSTLALPHDLYPLTSVGKLVLNRNPDNNFVEIEQLAFCPGNLVPGMLGSPDKLFAGRSFSYRDTQTYRLGVNFDQIPVNCPLHSKARNYNRDGAPPAGDNGGAAPFYYPNSFNGPKALVENNRPSLSVIYEEQPNNFEQMSDYYSNELTSSEQTAAIEIFSAALCLCENFVQTNITNILKSINSDLGGRIDTYLEANCKTF